MSKEIKAKYPSGPAYEAMIKEFSFPTEHLDFNTLHPIYKRYLVAAYDLQEIWGHYAAENVSGGKARELSSVAIHNCVQANSRKIWDEGPTIRVPVKV